MERSGLVHELALTTAGVVEDMLGQRVPWWLRKELFRLVYAATATCLESYKASTNKDGDGDDIKLSNN